MPNRLGIVAGGGALPGLVARECRDRGREAFILALVDHAEPEVVGAWPHAWVRLGAFATAIRSLREAGVGEIVLAGRVRRPSLPELRPDARAARLLSGGALARGDDGLLSAVIRALETEEGFRVLSLREAAAGLLAGEGRLGRRDAGDEDRADMVRGRTVLQALSPVDVGQAVVVQDRVVLGIEAIEGTDRLILRCAGLKREGRAPVLVKTAKVGQDRRADLPAVGAATMAACREAGFGGVAVEAGGCVLIDPEATVAAADEGGLFLVGMDPQAA